MRKDELVSKAMDNLLIDPNRINIVDVVPVLAKNKQFQQIVHICLKKISHQHNCEASFDDIKYLLEVIVQAVEAVDTAIVSPNDSKVTIAVDTSSFMPILSKAVSELSLEQRLTLRNNLIAQLADSDVKEAISYVLQNFMFKNKEVDFICQTVSP